MRKLIVLMHISLDGFVAGMNDELDWIHVDEAIFDFVATMTNQADTALYGRITYEMMQNYWPTAAQQPNASKHDIEHAAWYNQVSKLVLSRTMSEKGLINTTVISDRLVANINKIKKQKGYRCQKIIMRRRSVSAFFWCRNFCEAPLFTLSEGRENVPFLK